MKTKLTVLILAFTTLSTCKNKEILPDEYHNVERKPSDYRTIEMQLSFTDEPSEFTVELIDSLVIIEGDIIVGTYGDIEQVGFAGIVGEGKHWSKGIMPYEIQPGHSKRSQIVNAIYYINSTTNLNIIPRSNEVDYVYFSKAAGCSSWVGKQGGRQNINIGNCSYGSIIHEILHASGFYHEQSRTDRENYISIEFKNVKEKSKHNFKRYLDRGYTGYDISDYDYNSIMHYRDKAFSKNGKNTINLKIPPANSSTIIGQRIGMSQSDIESLNIMYTKNKN
tara:strand:+ start:373 stop:1209 length:837 start_codon:yes stop_codon:yes gene_type:complete